MWGISSAVLSGLWSPLESLYSSEVIGSSSCEACPMPLRLAGLGASVGRRGLACFGKRLIDALESVSR